MTTNITVTEITNTISVDPTTNAITVTPTTQEIFVNTRTNKADIGLGNVDNTSDLDKPISTATQLYVDTQIDYLTTADIEENGNLYYTQARADARVAAGIAAIDYPVDSVNGQTNTVVLDTDDISEGTTNLYYTDARVDARFDILATGIEYPVTSVNGSTGAVTLDTDDVAEGTTNKYYTDARADARVAAGLVGYATTAQATSLAEASAAAALDDATVLIGQAYTDATSYTDTAIGNINYPVDSVNGQTQTVVLDTDDIAEGTTNKYYTDTRVGNYLTANNYATQSYTTSAINSAVAGLVDSAPETLDTLNELAAALGDDPNYATTISTALGQKLNTADFGTAFNGQFSGKTTSDLAEGTNLYYTDGRFDTRLATKTTTNLAEGTNLYYTDGRFDTRLATKTTSDLAEGTNQYFTQSRARSSVSVTDSGGDGSLSYDSGTGVITYTGPSAAEVRAHFSGGTGVTITNGSIAIGQSVATSASPTFVNGTFTGAITTAGSAASKLKRAVSGATGSGYPLILNRQATGAARVSNNGPHLGFEYWGTDNTEATSPVGAIRGLYDSGGENYFEILRLAGSYSTGIQTIARLKRGDHFFKNTSGFNSLALTDANASIIGQTATSGFASILNLTKRRTDVTAPTDGDKADFRIAFQGNTGSAISVGKFEGEYDATNGHSFTMNVYDTTGTTSITAVSTTQKETIIAAIPSAGGAPAAVATFNRDNIILGGATGTLKSGDLLYRRTFGCFHKMANVTAAAADTVYAFDWTTDTTAHVNTQGVTVSNTSRINFDNAGDYNIVIEMVGKNTDSQDRTAYVWLARNGTDIAETAIKLVLTKDTTTMLAKDWLVNGIADNDYLEVRFAVDTTTSGISLEYTAAQTTPYLRPAVAAATLTITPVGA